MAQRYASPIAHERMAEDKCPECGEFPSAHSDNVTISFLKSLNGGCNLLRYGVVERIEQYRNDLGAGAR